jgi:GH25 family lysozyme M1 (1,4-beta-N-acetylmuramidase)
MTGPAAGPLTCSIVDVFSGDADNIIARGLTLEDALAQAKAAGLCDMVIAKASEGGDGPQSGKPFIDPKFSKWMEAALANGLIFGAYHVGTDSQSGGGEAEFFAKTLRSFGCDPANMLCVLDREPNKPPMTGAHANEFVQQWRSEFGRWLMYYRDSSDLSDDAKDKTFPLLASLPIWVAAYENAGYNGPQTPFPWLLWQYLGANSGTGEWPADENLYPRTAPGVGQLDRSCWRGDRSNLSTMASVAGMVLPFP